MSIDRVSAPTRIAAGTAGTLSLTVYDGSTPADPGDVTVTVTRADGTAVVTDAPASGTGANPRTLTLTPEQTADVDLLTVAWKASTPAGAVYRTEAEIIGEHLFAPSEARAFRAELADAGKYPDEKIAAMRAEVHDQFEDICGVSFCPRYRLVTLDGGRQRRLHDPYHGYGAHGGRGGALVLPDLLPITVRSVEVRDGTTWTAFDQNQLAEVVVDPAGTLWSEGGLTFPSGRSNVRVGYVHGMERVPLDIRRAALMVAADRLVPSNVYNRATTVSDETGTYIMATPGMRGSWFGLPAADAVVNRYCDLYLTPGIA